MFARNKQSSRTSDVSDEQKREKVGSAETFKSVPLLKVDVNVSLAVYDKCLQNTECLEINLHWK